MKDTCSLNVIFPQPVTLSSTSLHHCAVLLISAYIHDSVSMFWEPECLLDPESVKLHLSRSTDEVSFFLTQLNNSCKRASKVTGTAACTAFLLRHEKAKISHRSY